MHTTFWTEFSFSR